MSNLRPIPPYDQFLTNPASLVFTLACALSACGGGPSQQSPVSVPMGDAEESGATGKEATGDAVTGH
ncbi:MAG: hypothetical protein GY811_27045 [Myxococcales bacterium]|nr:hypothetical protein [Myxococcales bacterium]